MFNKIVFSNYYLRKRRDLKKDGKASPISFVLSMTDINITFRILTPATTKEMELIPIKKREIYFETLSMLINISFTDDKETFSSFLLSVFSTDCCSFSTLSTFVALIITRSYSFPFPTKIFL